MGLTLKQQAFVKETVKTLNPTEAVRRVYQLGKNGGSKTKELRTKTATVIATENLAKPSIKKALREELRDNIDNKSRSMLIKRNAEQNKNLPASNQALDMLNKIHGDYAPEKKISVNISPANIDKLIQAKLNELNQLRAEGQAVK